MVFSPDKNMSVGSGSVGFWRRVAAGRWLLIAAVALAYFGAAGVSLRLAIPPGYASAVWPPAGIALAAWLLFGGRVWPGIWIGAALANVGIAGTPAVVAVLIGAGNTAEAAVAAWLIGRIIGQPLRFVRPSAAWAFGAIACASAAVAATGGVLNLVIWGRVTWSEAAVHWGTWWMGDAAGIILVTPLLVTWLQPAAGRRARSRPIELALFLAVLLLGGALMDVSDRGLRDSIDALAYVLVPLITWAATRLDLRAVTAASFALAAIAAIDLLDGGAALFAPMTLTASLLFTLLLVCLIALMGLTLSAIAAELGSARAHLAAVQARPLAAETLPLSARAISGLTPRELEVLRLVAGGSSNAEAARQLGLSARSVETYRARLMQKLDVDNLAALVKFAIRHGIVPLE
jgi:integral membrane sensor domain MASE1/DNA-binding CsgD family transcriptional regulator